MNQLPGLPPPDSNVMGAQKNGTTCYGLPEYQIDDTKTVTLLTQGRNCHCLSSPHVRTTLVLDLHIPAIEWLSFA